MENIINLLTSKEKQLVKTVELPKSKILFHEEEICKCIGILIEGEITISSYTISGNEIIYNSLKSGDIFGNNLVFSNEPKYKGSIIAKSNSIIGLIYKEDLLEILQNNKQFLIKYLEIQSNFGKKSNEKIKLLTLENVEERFLFYLQSRGGKIQIKSVTYLSNVLYAKRETISRLLTRLEKANAIKRIGKEISLVK